jgi:serine/threonine protein kinase/tetratricopeptide (TPR) repeat protein
VSANCPKCHSVNPDTQKFCAECGTRLIPSSDIPAQTRTIETPIQELTRGAQLAERYEIIEELGKGGMGKVYRVEDKKAREEIALKLIKPEIAADKNTIERFRNELITARKIRHKNICGMYDLGEDKGNYYITMEYVPGEDLKSFLRRSKKLTVETTISIGIQICEGLAEAHRLGVIHRDLKPNNIMIDKDGNVRIMDFGIARSIQKKGTTAAGVMIGTPEYMSPEQVEGKEVDQRSDIYALGVILFEMATGRVPFDGDTPFTVGVKQKSEIPPDPKEFNAQISEGLSRIILKCLEKDREKRFQSAGELRTALTDIEEGIPASERIPPVRKARTTKISRAKGKNIIIFAAAVLALILIIVVGISLLTKPSEEMESIAVLPLENLSGDPEQEYFADGMTERLISELAKISGLQRVISRMSVMQYKGVRKSMPDIAKELNVDAVVQGSVLLLGNRVSISAQLIHAPTDRLIWAENYENNLQDVLALQREVAKAIAKEIKVQLTPEEERHLSATPQIKAEAYQAYLKGLFYWNKRTYNDMQKAITFYKQAIQEEPDYALAYVGLADCYNLLSLLGNVPAKEAFPKAKEAALNAIALDETLGEAHNSLAYVVYQHYWDFADGEREFKRAIELNPNYATAHFWYGEFLMTQGRFDEAFREANIALELDPVSVVINFFWGNLYEAAGQIEKSVEQYLKTLEMDPDFALACNFLGISYAQLERYPEAIAAGKKAVEISGGSSLYMSYLGWTYGRAGKDEEARKILEELQELSNKQYVSPYLIATVYLGLGEYDKAFEWLDKAYEDRCEFLSYIKTDAVFDPVREDPRFAELLKKIGLQ